MKKTPLGIYLIIYLIIILFISTGCDIEPSEYNPKSKGWELLASGIVSSAYFDFTENKKTYLIKFAGGPQIKTNRFYNFNDIKIKDKGSIYKWKGDLRDNYYYMWVPDNNIVTNTSPKNKETTQTLISNKIIDNTEMSNKTIDDTKMSIKYEWQNVKIKLPPFYQTVLIKFKNRIVTTAYYTQMNVWKSEIDKKKMSGGIPLKNVVQWKLVDLE